VVTTAEVWSALAELEDPEIPVISLVDLGVVRDVTVTNGQVTVDFTPTFLGCPALEVMRDAMADQIRTLARDCYVGDTVLRQLAAADLILLNKVDRITDAEAHVVAAWLHGQAPHARIIRTVNARLPCEVVLGPSARVDDRDNRPRYRVAREGEDARAMFSTETLRCSRALSERRLREALDALPDTVLRAKGYVRLDTAPGDWQLVQAVGRRWTLGPAPATVSGGDSVLVLIGAAGAMRLDDSIEIVRLFGRA